MVNVEKCISNAKKVIIKYEKIKNMFSTISKTLSFVFFFLNPTMLRIKPIIPRKGITNAINCAKFQIGNRYPLNPITKSRIITIESPSAIFVVIWYLFIRNPLNSIFTDGIQRPTAWRSGRGPLSIVYHRLKQIILRH